MQITKITTGAANADPQQQITDAEAAAAFRATVNLFEKWGITEAQAAALLDANARTYARWKKARCPSTPSRDLKARLSNLMGIHKALRYTYKEPERCYRWVKQPNTVFGGKSALEVMLNGELTDLMRVRRYLDADRSPW